MNIAFTGHRPDRLGGYDDTKNFKRPFDQILSKIIPTFSEPHFIVGMALGVDTWAALFAIRNTIPFSVYIPFPGQEKRWPIASQELYHTILKQACKIRFAFTGTYAPWKMFLRDRLMVDDCDFLIAVWNGNDGTGTGHCVRYAQSKQKRIVFINPIEGGHHGLQRRSNLSG